MAVQGGRLPKRPESPFCLEVGAGVRLAYGAADTAHLALPSPSRLPPGLLIYTGTCAHWHGDCAYVSHAPLYSPCLATRCCAKDVCIRLNTCQKSLGSPRLPSLPQRSALTPRVLYSFFQPDSRFYYFPCSYFPAFPVFLPLLGLLCRPDFLAFQLRPFRATFNGQNPSRLPLAIHHLSPPPLPRKKKNKKKKLISCKSMEQKASKLQLSSGLSHAHVRTRL